MQSQKNRNGIVDFIGTVIISLSIFGIWQKLGRNSEAVGGVSQITSSAREVATATKEQEQQTA